MRKIFFPGAFLGIFLGFFLGLILSISASAAHKKGHHQGHPKAHHDHAAHVHGAATLSVAFDGLRGRIEFKAASEGLLGFEYIAKSEKDKKTFADVKAKLENAALLFQFEPSRQCRLIVAQIEQTSENEKHSDLIANYDVTCAQAVSKSSLTVDFSMFPQIQDLDITVLIDQAQQSVETKKTPVVIRL